jgi:hypothetical protein
MATIEGGASLEERSRVRNPFDPLFWKCRGLPRPKNADEIRAKGFKILEQEEQERLDRLREGREHLPEKEKELLEKINLPAEGHVVEEPKTGFGVREEREGLSEVELNALHNRRKVEKEKDKLHEENLHRPGRGIRSDNVVHRLDAKLAEKTQHGSQEYIAWEGEMRIGAQKREPLPAPTAVDEQYIELAEAQLRNMPEETGELDSRKHPEKQNFKFIPEKVRPTADGKERWKGAPERDEEDLMGWKAGERNRARQEIMAMESEDVIFPPVESGQPVITTEERTKPEGEMDEAGREVDYRQKLNHKRYAGSRTQAEVEAKFKDTRERLGVTGEMGGGGGAAGGEKELLNARGQREEAMLKERKETGELTKPLTTTPDTTGPGGPNYRYQRAGGGPGRRLSAGGMAGEKELLNARGQREEAMLKERKDSADPQALEKLHGPGWSKEHPWGTGPTAGEKGAPSLPEKKEELGEKKEGGEVMQKKDVDITLGQPTVAAETKSAVQHI